MIDFNDDVSDLKQILGVHPRASGDGFYNKTNKFIAFLVKIGGNLKNKNIGILVYICLAELHVITILRLPPLSGQY